MSSQLIREAKAHPIPFTIATLGSGVALCLVCSLLLDLYFFIPDSRDTKTLDYLQHLPMDWRYYAIGLALVTVTTTLRYRLWIKLGETLTHQYRIAARQGLSRHDWLAYRELRKRAFALRTQSGLALAGVFLLLFVGIYFIIFLLPQAEVYKTDTIRASVEAAVGRRYRHVFEAMAEGQYWFKRYDAKQTRREPLTPKLHQSRNHVPLVAFKEASRYGAENPLVAPAGERVGLIARIDGSVVITVDGGYTWTSIGSVEGQKRWEPFAAAAYAKDHTHFVLIGKHGTVFETTDRGRTWTSRRLSKKLVEYHYIATVLDGDATRGLILANEADWGGPARSQILNVNGKTGVGFVRTNNDRRWKPVDLGLKEGERITAAALSKDARYGVLSGSKGSLCVTGDGGHTWQLLGLKLPDGEMIRAAVLADNPEQFLFVTSDGSLRVTMDGGNTWDERKTPLKEGGRITAVALGNDGIRTLLLAGVASLQLTTDAGESWQRLNAPPTGLWWTTVAVLGHDRKSVKRVLGRSKQGSAFVTNDRGRSWDKTLWDGRNSDRRIIRLVTVVLGNDAHAVAVDEDGSAYILKEDPDLQELDNVELADMWKSQLFRDSEIFQEIVAQLADIGSVRAKADSDDEKENDISIFGTRLNTATLTQFVFLGVLFFLVRLLVSLYKYNCRLANFWDSRADAILLDRNFAAGMSETFNELVQALAPDAYDFQTTRSWLTNLRWPRNS